MTLESVPLSELLRNKSALSHSLPPEEYSYLDCAGVFLPDLACQTSFAGSDIARSITSDTGLVPAHVGLITVWQDPPDSAREPGVQLRWHRQSSLWTSPGGVTATGFGVVLSTPDSSRRGGVLMRIASYSKVNASSQWKLFAHFSRFSKTYPSREVIFPFFFWITPVSAISNRVTAPGGRNLRSCIPMRGTAV